MSFLGDYHTHTMFSHGKGTIEENVLRARELGLKEIAITDHGFKHVTYNVRRYDFHFMLEEVLNIRKKYPDIKIFLGLETNFNGRKGDVDIDPSDMRHLDILLCGYHKYVHPSHAADVFSWYVPNFIFDTIRYTPPWQVVKNTDTYIRALERYDIDVITHINYGLRVDVLEVAKACNYFGTFVELNGKQVNFTTSQIIKMAEMGTKFIVNSDAHSVRRVGEVSRPLGFLRRCNIPEELIVNYNKTPKFRSRIKRGFYNEAGDDLYPSQPFSLNENKE